MSWQLYLAGFILLEKTSEKFSNFSFFVGHRKHWHWHYPNIGWVKRGGGKGWFRIGFLFCIVQRYTCKSKEEDLIKIWDFVKLGIIISTCLESLKIVHEFLTSWVPSWVPYLLGSIECTFLIHCCLDIIRVDKTSLDRDPDKRSEPIPW